MMHFAEKTRDTPNIKITESNIIYQDISPYIKMWCLVLFAMHDEY
ncbi:hypothetical protein HMPREF3208_01230 [Gardnerella vaginalis]|uniref:Uncharacterized protein n=1 Tax=Gardnerella vaginalis TaxID=2702 RepID=A0A133NS38_GARVA|nr:hypothetical protein HMPREF3208_01230 [Gardnerella vaginalis]